jgi:hypothetical protein
MLLLVYATSNNIGVYSNAINHGVYAHSSLGTGVTGYSESGTGVYGYSTSGYGGNFESTNGTALQARTTNGAYAGAFYGAVYLSYGYTTSDKNLKHSMKDFTGAMSIINKLKPQYYEFKSDEKYDSLHLPKGSHYGLIAQDLERILPNLVSEASHKLGSDKPQAAIKPKADGKAAPVVAEVNQTKETITIKAVNYTELIPIIVKGMQELDEKTERINELEKKNQQLEVQMAELRKMVMELKSGSSATVTYNAAYLEQNTPNPVSGSTMIRYHVPETATSARLVISNAKGQAIRTITIGNKSAGQVAFNSTSLAAGTYNYTLYVNGKQADTKRLIIAR